MKYLQENNWLIDKRDISKIHYKLGIQFNIEEYYRDCYMWFPDI